MIFPGLFGREPKSSGSQIDLRVTLPLFSYSSYTVRKAISALGVSMRNVTSSPIRFLARLSRIAFIPTQMVPHNRISLTRAINPFFSVFSLFFWIRQILSRPPQRLMGVFPEHLRSWGQIMGSGISNKVLAMEPNVMRDAECSSLVSVTGH